MKGALAPENPPGPQRDRSCAGVGCGEGWPGTSQGRRAGARFPERHRLSKRRTKSKARTGVRAMHKGTIIAELIAAVERAEARAREANQDAELERWYDTRYQTVQFNADLLGVA